VFETGHLLLAKKIHRGWACESTRNVPDLPRHLLGPAGHARGDDLHAQPFTTGFTLVRIRDFAPPVSDGGPTVLLGGHGARWLEDNLYLEKGKPRPANAALVEKAAKIIEVLGDNVARRRGASNPRRAKHGAKLR